MDSAAYGCDSRAAWGVQLTLYLVRCDQPAIQMRLPSDAANGTFTSHTAPNAASRARHFEGWGFNKFAR